MSSAFIGAPAAPGLREVAEQAVLDPVPLRCARRIMVDVEHEPGLVGEPLQLDLPQPDACAIRAAAVGCDRQLTRIWIALAPHAFSHCRIEATANSAVSLVIPTLTQPALAPTSYTP